MPIDIVSLDFECTLTIYTKSRSIIAVVLHNSFIPLATRKDRENVEIRSILCVQMYVTIGKVFLAC